MLRTARRGLPLAVATAGLLLVAPGAQAAVLHCGDVVTKNTRLDNNLYGCSGPNALVISGTNVSLNLYGHTVTGTGANTGIAVDPASTGAKISNGRVAYFGTGIAIAGESATVTGVDIDHNTYTGVSSGASGSTVKSSSFDLNGVGVSIDGGVDQLDGALVQSNTITRSTREGIGIYTIRNASVIRNTVSGNGQGIRCFFGPTSVIDHNKANDNGGAGITTRECSGSDLTYNEASRNAASGVSLSDGSSDVIGNTASYNGGDGFTYFDNYPNTIPLTHFGSNRSTDNDGWGYSLMVGTGDLGGNIAKRNGLGGFTYTS